MGVKAVKPPGCPFSAGEPPAGFPDPPHPQRLVNDQSQVRYHTEASGYENLMATSNKNGSIPHVSQPFLNRQVQWQGGIATSSCVNNLNSKVMNATLKMNIEQF